MASYLYIKNMVCLRCQMAVQSVLQTLGIAYEAEELGWAPLPGEIEAAQMAALDRMGVERFGQLLQ
ncbi:MAG: hypothetical protein EOO16_15835 [Chitinophagaceae bacterium]|nr:MAG: hypothetical protein EOO16_15835 [Chitinophagaceae bacterium]